MFGWLKNKLCGYDDESSDEESCSESDTDENASDELSLAEQLKYAVITNNKAKCQRILDKLSTNQDKLAYINQTDSNGKSLLIKAAEDKQAEVCQILIESISVKFRLNAVNFNDNKGNTALTVAANNQDFKTVGALLKPLSINNRVAAVNFSNHASETALYIAVTHQDMATCNTIIRLLENMRLSVLCNTNNKGGYSALTWACVLGFKDLYTLMLTDLSREQYLKVLTHSDQNGDTLLHNVASSLDQKVCIALLKHMHTEDRFMAVTKLNSSRQSALSTAAINRNNAACNYFLRALPSNKRFEALKVGINPLVWAAGSKSGTELCRTILNTIPKSQQKAAVNLSDGQGTTAIEWAYLHTNDELVTLLKEYGATWSDNNHLASLRSIRNLYLQSQIQASQKGITVSFDSLSIKEKQKPKPQYNLEGPYRRRGQWP